MTLEQTLESVKRYKRGGDKTKEIRHVIGLSDSAPHTVRGNGEKIKRVMQECCTFIY
jgi:hypothetical protein